jgi:DNA-binding transcriptional ArsR family regulator
MPPGTSDLISAVSHPLRRRILRIYLDESLPQASLGELARVTEEPVARVAYHLKTLAGCGLLRLVHGRDGEDGEGDGEDPPYSWALDVEPDWLGIVLDFWAQSDLAG